MSTIQFLGGSWHGRTLESNILDPSMEMIDRNWPNVFATTEAALPSMLPRPTERYVRMGQNVYTGRWDYLVSEDYSLYVRHQNDEGAEAQQLKQWLSLNTVSGDMRNREVARCVKNLRLLELEAKFEMPDPRKLVVQRMLSGEVWWCMDEWCDCTQAQIIGWDPHDPRNAAFGGRTRFDMEYVWRGPFHTDGESGANDDLMLAKEYMDLIDIKLSERIRWPSP